MFLCVPATMGVMQPNEQERRALAARIIDERVAQYTTQIDAYVAAGINSATWKRAEKGKPIAERSLVAIVRLLWPETRGDWRRIDPPIATIYSIEDRIRDDPSIPDEDKDYILRLIAADRRADRKRGAS